MNIFKATDFSVGLINAIEPSSPAYPEGAAYVSANSRLDEDGTWNKAPVLSYAKLAGTDTRNAAGNIIRTSTNQVFTCIGGTVIGGAGLAVTPPEISVAASASLKGARQEGGIYFYMAVNYDSANKLESLPSVVVEHWVDKSYDSTDQRTADVPVLSGGDSTTRWYRSTVVKIKKGDTVQLGNMFELKFYFIGQGAAWNDYAHDNEIARPDNLYKGRGSFRPVANIDAIGSLNNRMFYFVDNIAYFSSAGRPSEVPQEYTLTIRHTYSGGIWTSGDYREKLTAGDAETTSLTQKPLLDTGLYAPAKLAILELVNKTVVRAEEINGKLWVFTANSIGHIVPTDDMEGFKYIHITDNFGLYSQWSLSVTPYGIFGVDEKGLWLFNETPQRITSGRIDLFDSSKETYITDLSVAFGTWVGELNEYWLSADGKQIVYQADRNRFVGPYYLSVPNNVAYIGGLYQAHYIRNYPNTSLLISRDGAQTLKFWLGQSSAAVVKDELDIDIIYKDITSGEIINVVVYQNQRASETGAVSTGQWPHTDSDRVGKIKPTGSGRFFEIYLSIPSTCSAPVCGIVYTALGIERRERALR